MASRRSHKLRTELTRPKPGCAALFVVLVPAAQRSRRIQAELVRPDAGDDALFVVLVRAAEFHKVALLAI